MSRVKLKIFAVNDDYVRRASQQAQKEIDNWIECNKEIQILSSDTSVCSRGIAITVKYYESKKRDLLLEASLKE